MSVKNPRTVLEVAVNAVGLRRSVVVLAYIAAWGMWIEATPDHEGKRTVDDYALFWNEARAKSFRDQKLFREAFPALENPTPIWESAREQVMERRANRSQTAARIGSVQWTG